MTWRPVEHKIPVTSTDAVSSLQGCMSLCLCCVCAMFWSHLVKIAKSETLKCCMWKLLVPGQAKGNLQTGEGICWFSQMSAWAPPNAWQKLASALVRFSKTLCFPFVALSVGLTLSGSNCSSIVVFVGFFKFCCRTAAWGLHSILRELKSKLVLWVQAMHPKTVGKIPSQLQVEDAWMSFLLAVLLAVGGGLCEGIRWQTACCRCRCISNSAEVKKSLARAPSGFALLVFHFAGCLLGCACWVPDNDSLMTNAQTAVALKKRLKSIVLSEETQQQTQLRCLLRQRCLDLKLRVQKKSCTRTTAVTVKPGDAPQETRGGKQHWWQWCSATSIAVQETRAGAQVQHKTNMLCLISSLCSVEFTVQNTAQQTIWLCDNWTNVSKTVFALSCLLFQVVLVDMKLHQKPVVFSIDNNWWVQNANLTAKQTAQTPPRLKFFVCHNRANKLAHKLCGQELV